MKTKIFFLFILPLILLGCLEDKSNNDIAIINPIVIDLGPSGSSNYSVYMFDTLKIEPLIYKVGTSDANLSYEWRLHSQYEEVDNYLGWVIDSTMSCAAVITAPPSSSEYYLKLTVTDDETGISNFHMFRLKVLSPFAEGLVVADTRDEQNSDLSLIIDRCFNTTVTDKNATKMFRDVWSDVNGSKIDGLVKGVVVNSYGTNRSLTVATPKTYLRADYYDYVNIPHEQDEQLFIVPPDNFWDLDFNGFFYDMVIGQELMLLGGQLWPRGQQNANRLYNYFLYPSGYPDYYVTHLCYGSSYGAGHGFDNKYKRIILFTYSGAFYPPDQLEDGQNAFDVNNLSDYEPLYMGQTNTTTMHLLTRQKSTGKYLGLTMQAFGQFDDPNNAMGKSIFDFSAATEIANVKCFATNVIEDAIYYATDTKIYATSIDNINSRVQWQAPSGEVITDIMVWKNNGYIDYEDHSPSSTTGFLRTTTLNRMMLITTYNESTGEGKITAVPIVTLGIGGLEQNPAYHRVFDGFGRILSICYQKS